MASASDQDRTSWITALNGASFSAIRARVEGIKAEIQAKSLSPLRFPGVSSSPSSASSSNPPLKSCGYVEGKLIRSRNGMGPN